MNQENKLEILGEGKQIKEYILKLHNIKLNDKKK